MPLTMIDLKREFYVSEYYRRSILSRLYFAIKSTWVKSDTSDTATQPFLSSDILTQSLLKSDRHFDKILLFCDTHGGNYKRVTFNFC